MQLELLPEIILAIAQQRSLNAVLATIVEAVAAQPGVALAQLWLGESNATCPQCEGKTTETGFALHLRASAGTSRADGSPHRIALESESTVAQVARTGESHRISNYTGDELRDWKANWIQQEKLVGFCCRPLIFHGEVLGVLALFRRTPADDVCWEWLRILADAAAIAVANARAYEFADLQRRELERERDYLREEVIEAGAFGEILGRSPALERVLRQVELVASTDANVLILGESGTGKELIARAIHRRSARATKPLVKVNCASIPRELFESEFFGHVRGSFTGALRDRLGRFQLAEGGTLFLDEVGDIPLELQSKLLRVLQEGEFERVGEDITRRIDVRVIAATNRDLRAEVTQGRFRLDLFYRLGVFPIDCPPLRERREDIPELAVHFVRQACGRLHLPEPRLTRRELEKAQRYDWPGNVRELQNVIERAVILASGGSLEMDLQGSSRPVAAVLSAARSPSDEVIPEHEWRERERANLLTALRKTNFRVSGRGGAAELLGVNPATLASRLKALGIARPRS